MPPRIAVRDIAFFERPVHFVRPFRFGAVVVNAASQAFVRVEIEIEGQGNEKETERKRQGIFCWRQRRNDGAEMVRQASAAFAGANRRRTAALADDRA